ncbi:hypothetical protein JOC48_004047 [Aquibacillus albus]|uniref:DUF2197 domain-containing protein n=1 Tax=Aquibacillus albus TaxID=1168171 RepID=A0ABS2N5U4_9BACI|nr:hypothetical protein [Aquibacillus albus]
MLGWLFGRKKCYICKGKAERAQTYENDNGEKILVCYKCVTYAERRAFKKL